jgi:CRP/FNR family cyclic AMP-dependent transcriptional regulator
MNQAPGQALPATAATDSISTKQLILQRHSRTERQSATSSDIRRALIASGIFSKLDPVRVTAVSEQLELTQFLPGDVVDAQSSCGGCVYVIISGKVKVVHRNSDGSEMVLTILGPKEMFGAVTLFDPESREVTATALTEVVAVPIGRDQVLAWIAEFPEFSDQILRLFARWVKSSTNALVDFGLANVQSRVANQLLSLRKRFGRREGEVVRVVHDLTMEDFSLLTGVAPETIGETLQEFQDRGWIRLEDNSVVIVDAHALASEPHMSSPEVHCV